MTDGKSYDKVSRPAAALRNMGVEVFAVGVGKRFSMRQLIQIASNRRHIFTADFRNLGSFVRAIKQKACKGNDDCFFFTSIKREVAARMQLQSERKEMILCDRGIIK